ncbi:SusC/RagA family TonB-linked outer membrane protein [Sphingobacterium faecale]|uniref:SusC/RagA family TonB-linked outer membrane protein n=1 Tax=Sphingobacterium faecale TaxID=2803775 RepID=A0ABS1R2Y8_9SPHI|nr:SusC/RagA family TonB-linked outer membrane protein [Sphingobacterium faecale]MBL1409067.1 SusC/RagA family TonB-linked outer membrane protein [Sphingobacterium faecale]
MKNKEKIWITCLLCFISVFTYAQHKITGIVKDAQSGLSISGVTIISNGENRGVTGGEGDFSIHRNSSDTYLEFRFVGYNKFRLELTSASTYVVELIPNQEEMEEVVVVGYGTQTKSKVTGSLSSVDMGSLQDKPTVNVAQALRGRVAGVQILDNGRPGQDPSILIRGPRSLSANNSPLIVLDGIIFGGNMGDINPNDILSMDILKDASATAIYGSKAANGVILLTSKRAKEEGVTISANMNAAIYEFGKKLNLFSPERYLQSKLDFRKQSGLEADPSKIISYLNTSEAENYKNGVVTDPYKMVSQDAGLLSYDINIAGRSEKSNYYISNAISRENGLLLNDNFKRYNFRANLETEILSSLKVGFTSSFVQRDLSGVNASMASLYTSSPYGTWYHPNGDPTKYIVEEDQVSSNAIYSSRMTDNDEKYNNLLSNFYANWDLPFVDGLSFRMNYSPNIRWNHNYSFMRQDQYLTNNTTNATKINQNSFDWVWENILKYNKRIDRHGFDVTLLFGKNFQDFERTEAKADQLSSDALGYNDLSLGSTLSNLSSAYQIKGVSSMIRLNYDYNNKYLLTLTTRRDGSSVFAANNKYALFPSVALAWNISNEEFMQGKDLFNSLKIRASYGSVGNQGIDPYQSLSLSKITQYVFGNGGAVANGAYPSNMGNDNLKWETTFTTNIGVDYSVFSNRISGSVDVYNSKTVDLLVQRSIPSMNGYLNVLTNIGEVQNRGIEFIVNTSNIAKEYFTWNSSFNFSYNDNKIKKLYGQDLDQDGIEDDDISNNWFIGHPITTYYDYVIDGIYQVGDDMPAGYKPGYVKLKDVNQDGKIDASDRMIIGSGGQPRYRIGFNNEFSTGAFTLSFMINAMTGWKSNFPLLNTAVSPNAPGRGLNQLDAGYWTEENKSNERPSLLYNNPQKHGWYVSRNFVRLQDVALSYTFPNHVTEKLHLKSLRVFGNLKNIWTISDWPGTDPEIGGTESGEMFSLPKIYSFGLGFSF